MTDEQTTTIDFKAGMTPEVDDLVLGLMTRLLARWNNGLGTLGIPLAGACVETEINQKFMLSLELREMDPC